MNNSLPYLGENKDSVDNSNTLAMIINDENNFKTISHIFDLGNKNETLKSALNSKKFWACCFMSFCSSCNFYYFIIHKYKQYKHLVFCYIIINTYRSFVGNRQEVTFLKNLAIFLSVGNGIGRPIWGFLFDRFGFKPLFIVLNVMIIIISSTFYFIPNYKIILAIYVPLCGVMLAGNFSLMPAFVSKVFGLKYV